MADDINNPQNDNEQDQEYIPPEASSQEFGSAPMSGGTESLASLMKNQKAMAAIGGVIFLYIIVSFFSSGGDDDIDDIVVPQQQHETTLTLDDHHTSDVDASPVSIFASIDEMNDESNKADEDMERMKTQVASLNRQNIDLRNRMDKIDSNLSTLTKMVERSSMQISALVKTQEKENKKETKEALQEFRIRAIISGRAWLEDGQGNNITVKVGDNLPTYGRIVKIKPVEGVVETSSGRTIMFSNNE